MEDTRQKKKKTKHNRLRLPNNIIYYQEAYTKQAQTKLNKSFQIKIEYLCYDSFRNIILLIIYRSETFQF